jgi:hypothetical protein
LGHKHVDPFILVWRVGSQVTPPDTISFFFPKEKKKKKKGEWRKLMAEWEIALGGKSGKLGMGGK